MRRTWAGEVRNVSLLVASAVNSEGYREILGICEGAKEDKSGWSFFLRHLVDRGLKGVQLIISYACRGLVESIADYLSDARWQRYMVHFYRNIFSYVPLGKVREVTDMDISRNLLNRLILWFTCLADFFGGAECVDRHQVLGY